MLRSGEMINKMYALSKWMWPLSHGDVTFQQEAKDEMLSEDFVPPGCIAECWVQGCWPRHSITSAAAAAAAVAAAAALKCRPCPCLTCIPWQNSGAAHKAIKDDKYMTCLFIWKFSANKLFFTSTHKYNLPSPCSLWCPTDTTQWEVH